MAPSRRSLTMSSFLIILVFHSFVSSCYGRVLDDQPSLSDHVDYSTYGVDDHDHGSLKDYLINSMARLFRFDDFGTTILNVDDFGAKGNGTDDDTQGLSLVLVDRPTGIWAGWAGPSMDGPAQLTPLQAFEMVWDKACSSTGRIVLVVP
ncbi:hypothetical protein L484_005937 [Morus notabilis]|uniref:Uncharacterized protein n=1 Tax=Morus notabilis TaxID=981085 RepID=W9R318_9ROSA|nr:hypothetical protein L484_005937 [Morus notabilis]